MNTDYQALPKLRDSISFVYIEHAIIEQEDSSIVAIRQDGRISIPICAMTCVLLGPGTSVTHAAIKVAADSGCLFVWCGEGVQKFYAAGTGETRSAANLLRQAELCTDPQSRLEVAKRMYMRRFGSITNADYSLQQLRGMEGIRVREAYKLAAKMYGVKWTARNYKKTDWNAQDHVNMALSQANAILYSVCQAAVVSLGYSTALGFIHTGKQLSFVYDVADLYKAEMTIPAAFASVKYAGTDDFSKTIRKNCRTQFEKGRLLRRISDDIEWVLQVSGTEHKPAPETGNIWDVSGKLEGGKNYDTGDVNW